MEIRNENDLKLIIEEYYNSINMNRKMQLEAVLMDFKRNPQSVDLAKQMIVDESNSSMVKFYFLSVLEHHEIWSRTKNGDEQVADNRQFLWTILTGNSISETFLRNKIAQIVADFGNHEFPQYWPSYFLEVHRLHEQSLDLCLAMIEATAVEFFSAKRSVPEQTLVYEQMSNLCQVLWRVFVWAIPEISGSGEQRRFRVASAKSSSPASPSLITQGDIVRNTCKIAFGVLGQLVEILPRFDIFWSDEVIEVLLNYSTIDPEEGEFSPMALNVIVDLLEKGHIPATASRYLPSLFAKIRDILTYSLTAEVDEEFKNKSISLAGAFFSIHLNRAVKITPDLLESTLTLFAKFTLKQEDEESFNYCIETWEIMIENGMCKNGSQSVQQICGNFAQLLYEAKLIEKDSTKSLDLIEKICNAYPQEIFPSFIQNFIEQSCRFCTQYPTENNVKELIGIVKVVGRISSLLESPFMDQFALAKTVLLQNAQVLNFIHSLAQNNNAILSSLLLQLTNALYNNLTGFIPWLTQYQNAIIENETEENNYTELVSNLITFTLQWQERNSCDHWGASARFLSNCVEELRPDVLNNDLTTRSLNDLITNRKLPFPVCLQMWNFASTLYLVLPFGKRLSRSDWHRKSIEFKAYIDPILQELDQFFTIDMKAHSNPHQVRMELIFVFVVIKSISTAAKAGNNSTRDLAFDAIQHVIPRLVQMIPLFSQDEEGLSHLFESLGLIVSTFKYQLSKTGNFDVISNTYEFMENYMLTSPKPAADIVTHIFDVFTLIATENSKQFDGLVKRMIGFIKQFNEKLLANPDSPVDLSLNMYLLIETVIKNHWTYFFGSKIHGSATPERQQEFLRLFEILAATLSRNETDIARQVIGICKDINQQYHLFEKELFTEAILIPFATGLIALIGMMENMKEDIYGLLLEVVNNRKNYVIVKDQVFPKFEKLDSILIPLMNLNTA